MKWFRCRRKPTWSGWLLSPVKRKHGGCVCVWRASPGFYHPSPSLGFTVAVSASLSLGGERSLGAGH